ncbi:PEP5 E3 ubiquitin-protein ligase PEP5 [Candida maltosa Xu316]
MTSPLLSWRQFQLFDFTPIRDPNLNSTEPLYSDPTLTCINATTSTYLFIAVNNSTIKIINPKTLTCEGSFQAYDVDYRITFMEPVHNSNNLIVTLAENQGKPSVIKLWDITKMLNLHDNKDKKIEEADYKYEFQTQVLVSNQDNAYPISCFKFNYDLTCLAVGYTNGKVILIRGDLLRDRGSKQRVVYNNNGNDPITGIQFNEAENLLYVTTTGKILTISTSGKNQEKPTRVLSSKLGVDLNCNDIDQETQNLIVGVPDSIQFYDTINKISTINFETPKSKIFKFNKNFLLIISSQDSTEEKKLLTRVLILDLVNNHISFNLLIPNNTTIFNAFLLSKDLYLLTNDGVLYKIHEKSINQQIEIILQRELFSVAFNLAKQSNLPNDTLLKIKNLQADYLYNEGKFDDSIDIYIECLELFGTDEGEEDIDEFIMNIITKFKEGVNVSNLTKFLIRLYEKSIANIDHITLLLCCYCKLKKVESLDKFIDELDLSALNLQDLDFELIINLFKECGFYDQVLKLLNKLDQPNLIVDIQLNDLNKPKLALNFMKTLSIDDLLLILIDHSKNLLDSSPIETTELLINVFTGKYRPNENVEKILHTKQEEQREKSVELSNYRAFLNYLSLQQHDEDDQQQEQQKPTEEAEINQEPTYLPPKPNLIYASFTNHPKEFVIFLEASIEAFNKFEGNAIDKQETLLTLLEVYLSLDQTSESEGESEWLAKANSLCLEYSDLLDSQSLLLLSHLYDFKPGEVLAQEKTNNEIDLFITYTMNEDLENCFDLLYKYGDAKPELYKLMLNFVISQKKILDKLNKEDIQLILGKIKKFNLLSTLELIEILSAPSSDFITFGIIKDYLLEYFKNINQEIKNNEKLIEKYENESTKNSLKLNQLLNNQFVIKNNKCNNCGLKLDYPVVHFKCNHSYHTKCLVDPEICPLCN